MKAFVTGGTGFIGGRLVERLLERGDQVTALVRTEQAAEKLRARGAEPALGDIRERESMRAAMAGCDVVFHTAGWYQFGAKDRQSAEAVNVQGTRNVLSLAHELGAPRIVYTSTVAIYGDTRGRVIDETTPAEGGPFATEYDRTKWLAHLEAQALIEQGAPVIIVQPGAVYGPGDHSNVGAAMEWFLRGYFPIFPAPNIALAFAYIDDVVEGHILAAERGRPGESYILTGPAATLRQVVELCARITGRPAPVAYLPPALVKPVAPALDLLERWVELPALLSAETMRISDFHYLARSDKARRELGWQPRSLEEGMRQTLAALEQATAAPPPEEIARRFQVGKIAAASLAGLLALRMTRRMRRRRRGRR